MPSISFNSKKKLWVAAYVVDGQRVFKYSKTRSGAEAKLPSAPKPSPTSPTASKHAFSSLVAQFLAEISVKESTRRRYEFEIRELQKYTPEYVTAENLPFVISRIRTKVESVPQQNRLVKRLRSLVKSYLTISKHHIPRYEQEQGISLNVEQIRQVLLESKSSSYYHLIAFLLDTGARVGEAIALDWKDLYNGSVYITKTYNALNKGPKTTSNKTKRSKRRVTLSPQLNTLLEQNRGLSSDPLFPAPEGGRVNLPNMYRRFWNPLQKKLGFRVRIHDLRHTHATTLLNAGIDPRVVSARLGHASVVTTLTIYDHLIIKDSGVADSLASVGLSVGLD